MQGQVCYPALRLMHLYVAAPTTTWLLQVDVYSLAMLLLECVEGVRPWKGHNMVQVAFQVRAGA